MQRSWRIQCKVCCLANVLHFSFHCKICQLQCIPVLFDAACCWFAVCSGKPQQSNLHWKVFFALCSGSWWRLNMETCWCHVKQISVSSTAPQCNLQPTATYYSSIWKPGDCSVNCSVQIMPIYFCFSQLQVYSSGSPMQMWLKPMLCSVVLLVSVWHCALCSVAGGDSSIWKHGDNSTVAISCNADIIT